MSEKLDKASIISAALVTAFEVAIWTINHAGDTVTPQDLEDAKARALLDISRLTSNLLEQEGREWAIVRGGK